MTYFGKQNWSPGAGFIPWELEAGENVAGVQAPEMNHGPHVWVLISGDGLRTGGQQAGTLSSTVSCRPRLCPPFPVFLISRLSCPWLPGDGDAVSECSEGEGLLSVGGRGASDPLYPSQHA